MTFELGISLGEVGRIDKSRRTYELDDPFTWQVICDGGAVTIRARVGKEVTVIGRAVWRDHQLEYRSGTPGFPNDHQWEMVATALATANAPSGPRDLPPPPGVPAAPVAARVEAPPVPRRSIFLIAAGGLGVVAASGAIYLATRSPSRSHTPAKTPAAAREPAPAPTPPPTLDERVTRAASLAEATRLVTPRLGDGQDNRGAWMLARYAAANLVWSEELATPETTLGLVLKDSERERGKRLCVTGVLRDIERRDLARRPVYVGDLETAEGDLAHFIAVGSTGSLVKRSTGTLCGVVSGKHAKAVVIVGLFDLPENRAPAVER